MFDSPRKPRVCPNVRVRAGCPGPQGLDAGQPTRACRTQHVSRSHQIIARGSRAKEMPLRLFLQNKTRWRPGTVRAALARTGRQSGGLSAGAPDLTHSVSSQGYDSGSPSSARTASTPRPRRETERETGACSQTSRSAAIAHPGGPLPMHPDRAGNSRERPARPHALAGPPPSSKHNLRLDGQARCEPTPGRL